MARQKRCGIKGIRNRTLRSKSAATCSYDARAGQEALVSRDYVLVNLSKANSVTLQAGDFALVMTQESFRLPLNMAPT